MKNNIYIKCWMVVYWNKTDIILAKTESRAKAIFACNKKCNYLHIRAYRMPEHDVLTVNGDKVFRQNLKSY